MGPIANRPQYEKVLGFLNGQGGGRHHGVRR